MFEYKKAGAIRQRTITNDDMITVIKARMRKDLDWVVNAIIRDKNDIDAST